MSTLTSTFATAFPGQVANLITAGRVALPFLATAFAVSGDAMPQNDRLQQVEI